MSFENLPVRGLLGGGLLCLVLGGVPVQALELSNKEYLGSLLYSDMNLSLERNQSCASCHSLERETVLMETGNGLKPRRLPTAAFVDPDSLRDGAPVSAGSVDGHNGTLNAPSVGYAAFSPSFHWDAVEGLYVGGQFWNGRALTLAGQAAQPLLNPDEMALPSEWAVVTRLKDNPRYVHQFRRLYGIDLDLIPAYELAPAEQPAPAGVQEAYAALTEALSDFEKSRFFNRFDSKFDFVMAGLTQFSEPEQRGFELFTGKAQCSACHVSDMTIAPDGSAFPPLFTDFTYDNLGVPRNVRIPGNPEPDPGLGGREDIADKDPAGNELGKQKVMSLRNIAVTPPYMHNGVFNTLEQVVHFYNTRDVLARVCSDNTDSGFGVDCWPAAEFPATVNSDELGDLQLTAEEEADLVVFLNTLTDNYPRWGQDAAVPEQSPSPFSAVPFPPFP